MRPIVSLRILALLLCLLLCTACGKTYRTDVSVSDLQAAIEPTLEHAAHLDTADADYLRFNLAGTEQAAETLVRMSVSGTTLDEYGIFRAASAEDTASLTQACEAYLKARNDAWLNLYMIDQYPKLRDAEVKVFGQYVVYLILSEEEKAEVVEAIETALQ